MLNVNFLFFIDDFDFIVMIVCNWLIECGFFGVYFSGYCFMLGFLSFWYFCCCCLGDVVNDICYCVICVCVCFVLGMFYFGLNYLEVESGIWLLIIFLDLIFWIRWCCIVCSDIMLLFFGSWYV